MSGGLRVRLDTATRLADELVELLSPVCERIEIAGSIRREQEDVGDVDLLCIPRFSAGPRPGALMLDLFEPEPTVHRNLLDERCAELLALGLFEHRLDVNGRKSWGSSLKKAIYRGLALDICSATAETWGYWLAVRTGPADFSRRLVTDRRYPGGLCPHHLHFKGGRLRRRDTEETLDTPDEIELFHALGVMYLPPIVRTGTVEPRRLQVARS